MSGIRYANKNSLVNSYASECMKMTPIIPIPRSVDAWRGSGSDYADAWHWDFGSVYLRSNRIDILFAKEKCEDLEVSREYCRDELSKRYPGGLKVDSLLHDSRSLRYYFTNSGVRQ